MSKLKQYFYIFFFSIVIAILAFEIFLRYNHEYLYNFKQFLPDTPISKKMKNEIADLNKNKKFNYKIGNKVYTLYKTTFEKNSHKDDLKYGAVNYNYFNEGFCNKNPDKTKSKIIAVGDSFTYCLAIKPEDAWVKKIFNLNENESLNFGIGGYGTDDYYNILKNKLTKNTNLVVFAFYEGNDFRDILRENEKKLDIIKNKNSNIKNQTEIKGKYKIIKKYLGNLYIFNLFWAQTKKFLLRNKQINFRYQVKFKNKFIKYNIGNSDIDEVTHAKLLILNENKSFYKNILQEGVYKNFTKASNLSKSYNVPILFLYIPSAYSSFGYENTIFEDNKIKDLIFEYSDILSNVFMNTCNENNLNCINLKKNLIKFNSQSSIPSHFPHNLHLTPKGHAKIAEIIEKYICKNFLNENPFLKKRCLMID